MRLSAKTILGGKIACAVALMALNPTLTLAAVNALAKEDKTSSRVLAPFVPGLAGCPAGVDPVYCQMAHSNSSVVFECALTTPEASAMCSRALVAANRESTKRDTAARAPKPSKDGPR